MISIAINEQQCIRCLLEDPTLLDYLEDNYFVSEIGKIFYRLIKNSFPKILDNTTLLKEGNRESSAITRELIDNLQTVTYHLGEFPSYVQSLKEDYAKLHLQTTFSEKVFLELSKKSNMNLEVLSGFREDLDKYMGLLSNVDTSKLINPEQLVDDYIKDIRKRGSPSHRYSYGDSYLDRHLLTGAIPQTITTFFGATGVGKSTFVLNLVNQCFNKRIPCVYNSLEMDKTSTMDRLIANRLRIPMSFLYPENGDYVEQHILDKIEKERQVFTNKKSFLLIEEPTQSIDDIERFTIEAKKQFKKDHLIMYIDLWSMVRGSGSQAYEIEEGMNRLSEVAKRTNSHYGIVLQANRDTDNKIPLSIEGLGRLRPTLNNIKNSASYAERSRVVLSVFRPKYYANRYLREDPTLEEAVEAMDDTVEVSCLKNSQGNVFNLHYLYTPEIFNMFPLRNPPKNA